MPNNEKEKQLQEEVKALYKIMCDEKVEEMEIKSATSRFHIRRKTVNDKCKHTVIKNIVNEKNEQEQVVEEENNETLKSPLTGVFYRSASPSSPTFVKEGDIVAEGKTLCIVEAMKVMNEIKAPTKVKILKILIENGKPVDKDTELFVVEKM
ncbi:acetyl-CoA carboxylase biotin carboxyl carrier protein [Candidatus Ruminimicrobium bovinum]|uniref:acetyl-CoA carboxylase biotin carboxyl carrier protein n=1 Tax=Candidatus Ruminimicrobium bovinum TaxID=3242779 RepID=UPI0039B94390